MNKKKKIIKITLASVCYLFAVIFVAVIIVAHSLTAQYFNLISMYLGHTTYKVVDADNENEDTEYFKRKYTTQSSRLDADAQLCQEIESEGIVLLKNENGALPLKTSASDKKKITMFGTGSRDFVYGGTGSGSVDASTAPTLQSALEKSNYAVNQTVVNFYASGRGKNYVNTTANISGGGSYVINEAPESAFTSSVKSSFAQNNDMALVVFNRAGSESSDLPKSSSQDGTRSYLELTADEESLLTMVSKSEYGFKRIVVIINSATPMELGFLEKTEYKIDACLWVGNVGQTGMYAIGEVLNGNVNPSGGLVDTYAYDTLGAPTIQNQGGYSITNATNSKGNGYMVYAEGIYVGYRYYETRYEDTVLNQGSASANVGVTKVGANSWNYSEEVQFPFGYNSSYSDFEWSNFSVTEAAESFDISLTVTNKGPYAGKDIVQIYLQSPYTEYDKTHNIEKAAIELVGFAKTSKLDVNASEPVTISIDKEQLKTYDANGEGTYIIDAGKYYFAAGENAHDALNNILAAKGKSTADGMDYNGKAAFAKEINISQDLKTYSVSQEDKNYKIVNQFADADIKTYDSTFKYLSRNDWQGTYPTTYQNGKWVAPDAIVTGVNPTYQDRDDTVAPPTQNAERILTLAMLMSREADDLAWEDLINQMSYDELCTLVKDGGYMTRMITSVGAPQTLNLDGPSGVLSVAGISISFDEATFSWVCEVVLAATWNTELAERMGEMIGEDALANSQGNQKIAGWYAPAMNIHRSAYSGRNFEYYSEDGFLSGKIGAAETKGATGKGVICYLKHFALNDQETNRTGGLILSNEQAIREIYLKPFEYSVREGGALGVMVAMNRVGINWAGGHKGLMTETLRNEWGFKGVAVTDQASFPSFYYEDIRQGLSAGTDMWLNTDTTLWTEKLGDYSNNPLLLTQMRTASKHILYAVSHSLGMNGISSTAKIVSIMPTWQKWLITVDVFLCVISAGLIALGTWQIIKVVKSKKALTTENCNISNTDNQE